MNRIALAFVGLTLAAVPALAQSSSTSTSNTNMTNKSTTSAATINYMTSMKPDEWRASKLKGVNVYNNANEKIGDVNEILISNDGKIDGVVIGVGGFLGMGEHDVAVPFQDLKPVMNAVSASNASSTTSSTTNAANTASNSAARTSNDVTGTVHNTSDRGYPDHFVLDATKDQLKAAPQFKYSTTAK